MDWIKIEDQKPLEGQQILGKLGNCRLYDWILMVAKYDDGRFKAITEWIPVSKEIVT